MGKTQILARPTGIQKEKNHSSEKALNYKECMAFSLQI